MECRNFAIRAEMVSCEGTRLVALEDDGKNAELWAFEDGSRKKAPFTTGSRITFDVPKGALRLREVRLISESVLNAPAA